MGDEKSQPKKEQSSWGMVVVLSKVLLYIVLFFLLYRPLGSIVFIFSVVPAIAAAWYYGVRGAIAGSILVVFLDILFIYTVGPDSLRLNLWHYIISGTLTLLATGGMVGLARRLGKKAQAELAERRHAEGALQAAVEAERMQRQMAESLRETAALLNSTFKVEDVLDRIINNIQKIAAYDAINIMLVEQDRVRAVRYKGYAERGIKDYIDGFNQKIEDVPGFRWMMLYERPLVVPDTRDSPSWLNFSPTAWIRSFAGIPLAHRGQIIGFLNLNSSAPGFYTDEYIEKLQPFADQAALAIENARAFENIQQGARRLAALNQASAILNKPVDYRTTLQAAVDCFKDALDLDRVYLALFTREWRLVICAGYSATAEPFQEGVEIDLYNDTLAATVVEKKTRLLAQSGSADPHVSELLPKLQGEGINAQLLLPLVIGIEVIGLVGCQVCSSKRRFRAEEVDLASAIANLAAVRIEQARIFDEERRQVSSLALLHAASLDISMSTSQPDLLKTIAERATWLGNAQGGSLYLCNPQKRELVCKSSFNFHHNKEGSTLGYGEGAAGRVAESGKPLIVDDYASWIFSVETFPDDDTPVALLSVPVIFQGTVTGVIQLLRVNPRNPFTEQDTELLGLFSSQVATALENTRLYDEIQQIAIRDPLTGVYNRRGLDEVAEREIDRARRYQRPLSLFLVDIDHFKRVNDTYGHPVGDEVLIKLAHRLEQNTRSVDILGRYGGEEFIILAVENDLAAAQSLAERMCHFIASKPFATSAGTIPLTVSVGVAQMCESTPDLPSMVQAADQALYLAKHYGRNQVQCFTGTLAGK